MGTILLLLILQSIPGSRPAVMDDPTPSISTSGWLLTDTDITIEALKRTDRITWQENGDGIATLDADGTLTITKGHTLVDILQKTLDSFGTGATIKIKKLIMEKPQ